MPKRKNRKKKPLPTEAVVAPRNPYSLHPLMKKGGVHQKSNKTERSKVRRETKVLARDWTR